MSSTYTSMSNTPSEDVKINKEESVLLQIKPRLKRHMDKRSNQVVGVCKPCKARLR